MYIYIYRWSAAPLRPTFVHPYDIIALNESYLNLTLYTYDVYIYIYLRGVFAQSFMGVYLRRGLFRIY